METKKESEKTQRKEKERGIDTYQKYKEECQEEDFSSQACFVS